MYVTRDDAAVFVKYSKTELNASNKIRPLSQKERKFILKMIEKVNEDNDTSGFNAVKKLGKKYLDIRTKELERRPSDTAFNVMWENIKKDSEVRLPHSNFLVSFFSQQNSLYQTLY